MSKIAVVVPNWNGMGSLADCVDSLESQSINSTIIVVDNGSKDDSLKIISKYKNIELIKHSANLGYAGGVNPGFKFAIENNYDYVAPFNNDAIADKDWLSKLVECLDKNKGVGIATPKIISMEQTLDSTGDYYTIWGLPYPRGRDESGLNNYDKKTNVFGGSGGASLYRVSMLKQVGLLDEDFFAYYEDVDLSFRAQLLKWRVKFVSDSIAYHQIGATSSKVKGFTTYQTLKNLPMLLIKNVPSKYMYKVLPRFMLAYSLFLARTLSRFQFGSAVKGLTMAFVLLPKNIKKRRHIQNTRIVADEYVWEIMVHDLPPNANALRKLRSNWSRLKGRHG